MPLPPRLLKGGGCGEAPRPARDREGPTDRIILETPAEIQRLIEQVQLHGGLVPTTPDDENAQCDFVRTRSSFGGDEDLKDEELP